MLCFHRFHFVSTFYYVCFHHVYTLFLHLHALFPSFPSYFHSIPSFTCSVSIVTSISMQRFHFIFHNVIHNINALDHSDWSIPKNVLQCWLVEIVRLRVYKERSMQGKKVSLALTSEGATANAISIESPFQSKWLLKWLRISTPCKAIWTSRCAIHNELYKSSWLLVSDWTNRVPA